MSTAWPWQHFLLSVTRVSQMQLIFQRNPENPGNVLTDNPDIVGHSSMLHQAMSDSETDRPHEALQYADEMSE